MGGQRTEVFGRLKDVGHFFSLVTNDFVQMFEKKFLVIGEELFV